MSVDAVFDLLLAIVGGAVRVGTPFLFVSLGECLTEKSGRINLGLEGVLVFSAMPVATSLTRSSEHKRPCSNASSPPAAAPISTPIHGEPLQ